MGIGALTDSLSPFDGTAAEAKTAEIPGVDDRESFRTDDKTVDEEDGEGGKEVDEEWKECEKGEDEAIVGEVALAVLVVKLAGGGGKGES